MPQIRMNLGEFHPANFPKLAKAAAVAMIMAACFPASSLAQQPGQRTFLSAQRATDALVAATRNNDEKALLDILGRGGKQVITSGDATEDAEGRANFVQRYQEMHRLVKEPDGTTVLYIGAHNWPCPIPLIEKGHTWYFDTESGKREILYRRIGRNEISAIRVCQELVASEKEYSAVHKEYARKIFSNQGQQDGLYWRAANGEPQSPIGPLVAAAVPQSFAQSQAAESHDASTPYRGYYFHLLTGEKKKGGHAKSYLENGKMTGGFAFVAYPAEYRSSGVMTFIVNEDGTIYEKDLGPKTESVARSMKEYNAGSGWQKSEGQEQETAAEQTSQALQSPQ
jgi:Protein of unknown function (DUF2950)